MLVFTTSRADVENLKADLQMRLPKEHFDMCAVHSADQVAAELRKLCSSYVPGELPKTPPMLSALVSSHVQKFWPKHAGDNAANAPYAENVVLLNYAGAPPELRGMKADYVLKRTVEHIFREHTACIVSDGTTSEHDRNRITACIHAGWQRRQAQRWIGGLYLGFCVFCVLFIKGQKSKAFGRMQRFSEIAASATLSKYRETPWDYEI